jgi:putative DNA primase/helicase
VIRWTDRDGRDHTECVERRLSHGDGGAIAARLEAAGLRCGTSRRQHELLCEFFSRVTPTRRLQSVSRTGWHHMENGLVFVLPNGSPVGPGSDRVIWLGNDSDEADAFGSRGTLAEWQQQVAALAIGNDRMAFCISTALASTLLEMTGEQSGGVHFNGKSRSGKSATLEVGCSTWGRSARGGIIVQWRGTDNGLEGRASARCDLLLPLDEIGQADPRTVGDIVYMLFNEAGKQRASRTGAARRLAVWRLMVLSTGETTLAAKMAEAGKRPMTGLEIRMVDVPADAGVGKGAFQDLHGFPNGQAFADHVRQVSATYYGTAGSAFLSRLVSLRAENEEHIRDWIAEQRKQFMRDFVPTGADGQVLSVANRFALIAAAGEMATRFNVLPWPRGEAVRAAAACFRAWLRARGSVGAGEDARAVTQVRAFIEQHGESRFTTLLPRAEFDGSEEPVTGPTDNSASDTHVAETFSAQTSGDSTDLPADIALESTRVKTINRVGYRKKDSDGCWEYWFLPESWKDVCLGLNPAVAAKAVEDAGFLRRGTDRQHRMAKRSIPGHGQVRCYVVSGRILMADDPGDTESTAADTTPQPREL